MTRKVRVGEGEKEGREDHHAMPQIVHVVGCRVLESALRPLLQNLPHLASCRFLEYGLHTVPERMTPEVQAAVDAAQQPGIVLLGYGLCGNGVVGLRARKHTLIIPKVDDCIALLMGSYQAYLAQSRRHPGTYYLSKGWLESGHHPLGQFREWSARYGEAKARQFVERMYRNYRRVVLIAFTPEELDRYRPQAQEVARFLGVAYEEILGSPALLERLVERASSPDQTDDEFVVVPPGAAVRQEMFIR